MSNSADSQQSREYQRMQRSFLHGYAQAFKWAILSYGFIAVYGALYGSEPVLVHRLGMTLAVLCGGLAVLFGALYVFVTVPPVVTRWVDRLRRVAYG
jgi:hypothetical protein